MINVLQVQYFLAVAQHLNFTKAAESLFTTQPTISRQIACLEEDLGFPLFIRDKRNVSLTPAGQILYKELKNINDLMEAAVAKAKEANMGAYGSISIGYIESINTSNGFPEIISTFNDLHPYVSLTLEVNSFSTLREKFLQGLLDIIFTISFEISCMTGIDTHTLYKASGNLVVPTSNPLCRKESLSMEDIKNEDFVAISPLESPGGYQALIDSCKAHGFVPNIVKLAPNLETLFIYLHSGIGIALLDENVRIYGGDGLKFYPMPMDSDDLLTVEAVWKKDNQNPALPLFVSVLKGCGRGHGVVSQAP
ncbi:MAG: LysR substrate-binding domain-containing protein [Anaerovoracaceae bacterium]|jgi:DNA-binding transcriptional LysR family regulator